MQAVVADALEDVVPEMGTAESGLAALERRERTRHLMGLVGDYALPRAYYWYTACGQSRVPLDAVVDLGAGTVSPGLARVVARHGGRPFTASDHPYANLIETQCHGFDLLERLCGPIDAISAEMTDKTGKGYSRLALALRFADGAVGSLVGALASEARRAGPSRHAC